MFITYFRNSLQVSWLLILRLKVLGVRIPRTPLICTLTLIALVQSFLGYILYKHYTMIFWPLGLCDSFNLFTVHVASVHFNKLCSKTLDFELKTCQSVCLSQLTSGSRTCNPSNFVPLPKWWKEQGIAARSMAALYPKDSVHTKPLPQERKKLVWALSVFLSLPQDQELATI